MSKSNSKIDQEQIEFLENAQKRIRQKKILYYHFIFFLFVSAFLFVLDFILNIGSDLNISEYSWSVWVFLIWIFLFLFHTFNVFVSVIVFDDCTAAICRFMVRKRRRRFSASLSSQRECSFNTMQVQKKTSGF